jgi:hypothetical protein
MPFKCRISGKIMDVVSISTYRIRRYSPRYLGEHRNSETRPRESVRRKARKPVTKIVTWEVEVTEPQVEHVRQLGTQVGRKGRNVPQVQNTSTSRRQKSAAREEGYRRKPM